MVQYLKQENGDFLLQENGDKIILPTPFVFIPYFLKQENGDYILQEDGTSKIIVSETLKITPAKEKSLGYVVAGEMFGWWEVVDNLPTDTAYLANAYTTGQLAQVFADDADRLTIASNHSEGKKEVHMFAMASTLGNTEDINIHLNLRTGTPATSLPVVLQIWNFDSSAWETIATNNTAAANTDFDLDGVIDSDHADYYSPKDVVYVRFYQ